MKAVTQICVVVAAAAALVALVGNGSLAAQRPPGGRPSTARPSTARPLTARPSTARPSTARPSTARPPTGERPGGFDWQGFVEGVIRDSASEGERPSYGQYPPRYPGRPRAPGGIRIVPESAPPEVTIIQPGQTPSPQRVTPRPNEVLVKVPRQNPPLTGRVWEVSVREARCYASQLQELASQALTEAEAACAEEGANMKVIGKQVDQLRQMLGRGASWRELEPLTRALFETDHGTLSEHVREHFQDMLRLLLVRDGFAVVGNGAPRGRGAALAPLTGIPLGLVWVLFDPTFPAGMGLVVNDFIVVCGTGGTGELILVRTSVADGLGLPVAPGASVPDISVQEAQLLKDSIVLRCHEESDAAVNYVLNSTYTYALQPGFKQKLARDRQWVVEFDRGGGLGSARYTLDKGSYEFRIVDGHWTLRKLKFEIVIDNREGTQDFRYRSENQLVSVKPGETKTHRGESPLVIEFDRGGDPEEPARKNLNKSGTYKIAVDASTNTWELFAAGQTNPETYGKTGAN